MRAVLQRVTEARVEVEGAITGQIGGGLLVLLGIAKGDTEAEADYILDKIVDLRIFEDTAGKMNLSVRDCRGSLLVVSQFTLYADCSRGKRPGFDRAAPAVEARRLYEYFVQHAKESGIHTETGIFQATMSVSLVNDGPVTVIIDSPVTQ